MREIWILEVLVIKVIYVKTNNIVFPPFALYAPYCFWLWYP